METPECDAAATFQGRAEERDDDLEHLPPLLEDEENVSLADILSLRDSCLSEQEVWAVCAECLQALQSIRPSHLFHTLCITPDTLAFNAHGNVCFMEQLSDDPEGSFVPPEFDNTGSTFEGHVYSLGSTLSAALTYVIEPELEAELGEEIQRLLQQMQEETPEDRPLLQDILDLAETRLSTVSSAVVCRKLSSIGRRVLSIESVSAFQDGSEVSWEARWQHPKPSLDHNPKDLCVDISVKANGLSRQQICRGWDFSLWAEDADEGGVMILAQELDCRSRDSSPVRRRAQQRQNRARGPLNRSCSVPDSNNPPSFPPAAHGDLNIPVCDLTEIGADEHLSSTWSNKRDRFNRGQSCDSYPLANAEETMHSGPVFKEDAAKTFSSGETKIQAPKPFVPKSDQSPPNSSPVGHSLYVPNNHMTKSMLCLNEESQDEWISLGDLLSRCGRRLTVNELWALCYTCLASLQSYIDFPAYLCLDTVHVGCDGDILFLQPKAAGSRDEFYLAPEYQEHGIVTEKACVYAVAAILWATAKFRLSPNQKLAVPRKLKRLLLEMAKRTAIERPSIVAAKKSCRDYLSHQGVSAETVWKNLISGVHPAASRDAEELSPTVSQKECEENSRGFVPTATESRLAPVPGPLPHSYTVDKEIQLPEAFTSTATHFSPIILTADGEAESQHLPAANDGAVDGAPENMVDSSHLYPTHTESCPPTQPAKPDAGSSVFNNYIFHQDPETGRLSLLPVLVRAPQSLPGLDINPSLVPHLFLDVLPVPGDAGQYANHLKGSGVVPDLDSTDDLAFTQQKGATKQGVALTSAEVHPALTEVIHLLKGEFSFNGYLDGREDVAMGEYIFSLKDLKYHMFAQVVKERFGNLYWEDDLLGLLHCLVNYSSATLVSAETPPEATVQEGNRDVCPHDCLDLNGNVHVPFASSHGETEVQSCKQESDGALGVAGLGLQEGQRCVTQSFSTDRSEARLMEGGDCAMGASDESPSEVEFPARTDGGLAGTFYEPMNPEDCPLDAGDAGSVSSEQLVSPGAAADGKGRGRSPSWALAMFGEDCFSKDVIQYAENLGQHTSACLDVKMQELQQQLIIETRDLKKTRNFYQKLIQQERKCKGPESKSMLLKLKSQFEELRSRVVFLECVKKYLEILNVERWGLEASLLPSLAVFGPGSLDLQSSDDPSVLCFGASRGKGSLQSGSPLGLMAYLYARHAALEGYIHQFLYTYRFFCTAEQLLQFIMDKFLCAARQGPDMSGDHENIFRRSLDLLHFWITDCKSVDFTPKSSLVSTLEDFLNTEVIPLDSRGEALLAALHTPMCSPRSQKRESLISFEEDDSPRSLHSSTEDLGKKWRISRVVEPSVSVPKEKAFSVAAALPMPSLPCLTDSILTNEEHLPFSQNEHSAHHIAQQLTLLQQEMFQGCHPVHFLNSRTQGVTDKISKHSKSVSPPAEGSSLPACEGLVAEGPLQQLLTYADNVSNWISAEIIICDSVKTQAALLTKYLWVGKHCYESRNFATAMQVLCGLENAIVRQLPAWKHLSSKVCEILEELRAVQVFLKSDDLCLTREENTGKKRPALPSVHILAMHVQQLEIGAFTLTTGAYKWNKLRNIAKVVSQVHAFQEAAFPYSHDRPLQAYLRWRISQLAASDVHLLAPDGDSHLQPSSESQTRKIQEKLRRMKASFH